MEGGTEIMTRSPWAAALLALVAVPAAAGGLDRTGQPIDLLFAVGNRAEVSFARTVPSISGQGTGLAAIPGVFPGLPVGTSYNDTGGAFGSPAAGVKVDITDRLSAALLFEQPFGTDVAYPGAALATELGGTYALARSDSLTALLRYRFSERLSAHGGLRLQRASGEIGLSGLAYGPFNGYEVDLAPETSAGSVLGVAYEIPDIALRVALTWNSAIAHDFDTTETGLPNPALNDVPSQTRVETPQSVRLDFQTGIAEDTLLFGSVRWAEWSAFRIDPQGFAAPLAAGGAGEGLVDLEDVTTWELGLGRQLSEAWAGSVAVAYEAGGNDLVSPLAPFNGLFAIALGASWTHRDVTISGGARYTWLGDARPETGTPDTARADFAGNTALTLGMTIGFAF